MDTGLFQIVLAWAKGHPLIAMLIGAVAVQSILFPRSIGGSGGNLDLDFGGDRGDGGGD